MKCQKYSGIGGQAVIEGIMMKNLENYAVAVRKPDGNIEIKKDTYTSMSQKNKLCGLPFVRGVFALVDSLVLGMKTLSYSASFFEDDEESEPTRLEKWLDSIFGEKLESVLITLSMIFAFVIAIGLFMLLPMFISTLLKRVVDSYAIIAICEGLIRLGLFILYIWAISHMPDINRTFMYHGSEHKCINCIEHGLPLTVANVMQSSKEHKRCGTTFLIDVMVISIIFFMAIRVETLWMRAASRIILVPVIAGVSYEVLRLAGRYDNKLVDIISRPGMWMQSLTTKEPTSDMAEVAIQAVESVFDWKAYLKENFGWEETMQ